MSFENQAEIQPLEVSKGKLSLATDVSKFGQSALLWQFEPGSRLQIRQHIGFKAFNANNKKKARHSFMSWIYNEQPITQQLNFQFGTGEKSNSQFNLSLNFRGWRAVAIPFETDMSGTASEAMDHLTITAPEQAGAVYFDLMALSIPVDPRWPTPDFQVPFVNNSIAQRANAHWGALLLYDNWQQEFESRPSAPATESELAAVEKIKQRVDKDILSNFQQLQKRGKNNKKSFSADKFARKALKQVKKAVYDKRGQLRPVQMGRQLEVYQKAGMAQQQWQQLNAQTIRFRDFAKQLFKLARAYRTTGSTELKGDVQQLFSLLVDHLHQQGYVRGSAVGIMHHQGYSMREWQKAIFLGRDMLSESQLKQSQQAIAWLSGLGRIFRPQQQNLGFNVDVMNTFLPGMLNSILLQRDRQKRVSYLRALSEWMSFSMLATKGLSGGIQSDGSFFHHAQHYVAYGNGGLNGLTPVVYYISHTPFALNQPAYERLRHGVMMTRIFSNGLKVPMSLAGRHPERYDQITLAPFKYLTLMGDKGVAQAYLRLMQVDTEQLARKGHKLQPEATPNGAWVMNYSSLAIQRRDEWLATARGFSRYLVGNETYANANHYGRYINYGHLEVLPSATQDSGYREAGWDWNRWPGTTTVHLPLDKLAADISQIDQYSGVEEMLLSTESYSGGNQLEGKNAMFAMKLRGHNKYQSDLQANKSVFMFDNRILALGSDISNSDSTYPTQTTLFQQTIAEDQASYIGQQAFTGSDTKRQQLLRQDEYYRDTLGNAYFVNEGQKVSFLRQLQHSRENEHKKPTQGEFASLIIEHGKAPQNGHYQYAILVDSSDEQAQAFQRKLQSDSPPFVVLQQDQQAHIVFDQLSQITAYALFEANGRKVQTDGILINSNRPIMLMSQPSGEQLKLSLTDPDLNFYQGLEQDQFDENGGQKEVSIYSRKWRRNTPQSTEVEVTLKGLWQGQGQNYKVLGYRGGNTVLQVTSHAATPVQISLSRR